MKQIIVAVAVIALVFAHPPDMDPACAPFNLPKNATFSDCCQMKVQMIPTDVFQKCASQFPKHPPPPPAQDGKPMGPPPMVCCITECVMKELKVFVDGKVDVNAAVTQLIGSDSSLKSTAESAVNYCVNKTSTMPSPPPSPGATCSPIPMMMIGCVYGQIYKNCGSQIVPNKPECTQLSDFAKKCDWVPPMKKD
ncbi:hypothetical protein ACKWTF_002571 [Chironomus riparius]